MRMGGGRNASRRGFLSGLARLPLIGGGITLIGAPTKAAVPVTPQLMKTYQDWLLGEWYRTCNEQRQAESNEQTFYPKDYAGPGGRFHLTAEGGWNDATLPSSRAAVVLSTVGCGWL